MIKRNYHDTITGLITEIPRGRTDSRPTGRRVNGKTPLISAYDYFPIPPADNYGVKYEERLGVTADGPTWWA